MLQPFNNIRKFIFGTTPKTADNALARLADLNNLVSQLNNAVPYEIAGITLVGGMGVPLVTPIIVFASATASGTTSCRPGTCVATRTDGSKWCSSAACVQVNRTSAGVITVTFSEAPTFGYTAKFVPKEGFISAGINKISPTQFIITTYNVITGALADAADKAYLEIIFPTVPTITAVP